jgi:type III pantothenate kinase
MILLLDIGNTHTHLGLATQRGLVKRGDIPTTTWQEGTAARLIKSFAGRWVVEGAAACSVVPRATALARRAFESTWDMPWLQLTARTARRGIGLRYPKPASLGPDRLANVIAARHRYGAPCITIDFGTAVTFDVVDAKGDFVGGVIAPGVGLMTSYLHEKTALLPRIRLGTVRSSIGRSTRQAMRVAAVHGFGGMVRELIRKLKQDLGCRRLPVVATGGYARWAARLVPEITALDPGLTLDGLRLAWNHRPA